MVTTKHSSRRIMLHRRCVYFPSLRDFLLNAGRRGSPAASGPPWRS